jgi:hypothetical protein
MTRRSDEFFDHTENIQAVDRLDGPVKKSPEFGQSATQPQPPHFVPIKKPSGMTGKA